MSVRWLAILILAAAFAVGYLAILNDMPVKVVLPLVGEFNPTSGWLMILSIFFGVICTIVFFAIRDWQDYFRRLAESKSEKMTRAAREKLARARNFLNLGLEDYASANLREALDRDPALAEAHEIIGDIYAARGDNFAAAASHSQALSLDRDNDSVRWKLAMDYHRAGNEAMASKVIKDGLELNDRNIYLLVRQRDLLVEQGDWEGALAAQGRLSRIRDYRAHEDHRHNLAGLHFEKGKRQLETKEWEEAAKSFEEASKLDPQMAVSYARSGEAYLAQGKEKQALKIWALGYRRTSDPAILSRLEDYYLQHNDPSRIINLYLRYIEEKPQEAQLRFQFANLLFKLEMLQEAQNQIEEVRRLLGDESPRLAYLSYCLKQKLDDPKGAMNEVGLLVEKCLPGLAEHGCLNCGRKWPEAHDRCPGCGRWGSLRRVI